MKTILEVTHRNVTACHYMEGKKYMIWYYAGGDPKKTVGVVQVRGLKEPLTERELIQHIDKLWERYHKETQHDRREVEDATLQAEFVSRISEERKAEEKRGILKTL